MSQEKFNAIRELINSRHYSFARVNLEFCLPDVKAQNWLRKLSTVAPKLYVAWELNSKDLVLNIALDEAFTALLLRIFALSNSYTYGVASESEFETIEAQLFVIFDELCDMLYAITGGGLSEAEKQQLGGFLQVSARCACAMRAIATNNAINMDKYIKRLKQLASSKEERVKQMAKSILLSLNVPDALPNM